MEAAAVPSKADDGNRWPAALPRAGAATMGVLSLLFAWLAARTLGRSRSSGTAGDDTSDFISVALLELSPLVCAYLFFWTIALLGPRGAGAVLVRATFLPLLAHAAERLIAPRAGAAAMFLATVYSAAALGRALAVRRQLAGTERTAAAAALSAPRYRSRAEVRHERVCRNLILAITVFAVATLLGTLSLAMLSAPQTSERDADGNGEAMLGVLMVAAGPFLLIARQLQLGGSPLVVGTETFVLNMVLGVVGGVAAAVVAGVVLGGFGPVVVLWAGALGMAGIFGYGFAVEAQYELLVAIRRSEPRAAQDASGLLVGRDEEDACSAHIDAATGLCVDCVLPQRPSRCTCWSHTVKS